MPRLSQTRWSPSSSSPSSFEPDGIMTQTLFRRCLGIGMLVMLGASAADILFLERASIVNIAGGLGAGSGRAAGEAATSGHRWYALAALTGGKTGPGVKSAQRASSSNATALPCIFGLCGGWLFRPPRGPDGRQILSFSNQPELQRDQASARFPPAPSARPAPRSAGGA